ncbi:hypothetical protein NPIL_404491, partial [Nephila pilipes]
AEEEASKKRKAEEEASKKRKAVEEKSKKRKVEQEEKFEETATVPDIPCPRKKKTRLFGRPQVCPLLSALFWKYIESEI